MKTAMVVLACVMSLSAFAKPAKKAAKRPAVSSAAPVANHKVSLPVGRTTTLHLPSNATSVRVSDPDVVAVSLRGSKVTLVGKSKGSAEAMVQTANGPTRLGIYVASDQYALPY